MKHILTSTKKTNVCTRWHSQALIDLQIADHAWLQIIICHQIALKLVIRWYFSAVHIFFWCRVIFCLHIFDLRELAAGSEALKHRGLGFWAVGRNTRCRIGWPEELLQRS